MLILREFFCLGGELSARMTSTNSLCFVVLFPIDFGDSVKMSGTSEVVVRTAVQLDDYYKSNIVIEVLFLNFHNLLNVLEF